MEELTQNVIRQDGGLYNIGTVKRLITVESYGDTFVIPDGVQVIGECAFWKCDKLKRVVIPDSVKDIGVGAFMGCEALKEVVIPNSVTRIERDTFSYCLSLGQGQDSYGQGGRIQMGRLIRTLENRTALMFFLLAAALSMVVIRLKK